MLKEFIREQGYGYILDLVVQDEDTVKLLWYMLVLIHQLKGSKEGLLLVLSLLESNFDPNQTNITQWYQTIPVGRPNTFTLETTIDVAKLGDGFFSRFKKFLDNYVYPEMVAMKVNYNVDSCITYRPYARVKIDCVGSINSGDTLNGGPANENLIRDVYDGGMANSDYSQCTYLTEVEIAPKYDPVTGEFIKYVAEGIEVNCEPINAGGAIA